MEFWSSFWAVTLVVALALFAILAVVVTVRGAQDVKALVRSLAANDESPSKTDQG
jgi:L-asparagine transporter-like permease